MISIGRVSQIRHGKANSLGRWVNGPLLIRCRGLTRRLVQGVHPKGNCSNAAQRACDRPNCPKVADALLALPCRASPVVEVHHPLNGTYYKY